MNNLDLICTVVALFIASLYFVKGPKARDALPYPPGPPGLPLLGNMLDMPQTHEWLTYARWSREYQSPLIHLNVLGTHIVIVNSLVAARQLFDRKSTIYSDRPAYTVLKDQIKADWPTGCQPYGLWWRKHRKVYHQYFHPNAVQQFEPVETEAARDLLVLLLNEPSRFTDHLRFMAGKVIVKIAYGIEVQPHNDPYVEIAENFMKAMNFAFCGRSLLHDAMPILGRIPSWLPGGKFNRTALHHRVTARKMLEDPVQVVKASLESGQNHSIAADLLRYVDTTDDQGLQAQDLAKHVTGTMYFAAADTTMATLRSFLRFMLLHPNIQKLAQNEIDTVVGNDRLPTFADQKALPYIGALLKEVLRCEPVGPNSLPHMTSHDDIYQGYFIPKGSTVIQNVWAVLHDPANYNDPESFNPDRFLNPQHKEPDPEGAFGFGRRICPGRFLAIQSVYIAMASILSVFNIVKCKDSDGRDVEPSKEVTSGLVSNAVPFECNFVPRSASAEALIQSSSALFKL